MKNIVCALLLFACAAFGQMRTMTPHGSTGGGAAVSCVGTPGNTTSVYGGQCLDTNKAVWICTNSGGCTVAANWAQVGSSGVTVTISTSGPVTVSGAGFYFNNASGALTYNLPAITTGTVGSQYCFRNSPTKTGAITLQSPASTFIDNGGTNGSSAGTFVSSGALGDAACVVAASTTQYVAYPSSGGWVNN